MRWKIGDWEGAAAENEDSIKMRDAAGIFV
jgi:hypothetical protein